MTAMINGATGSRGIGRLAPWVVLGAVVLYFVGYVDASVHAAAIGSPAILGATHEFFHHARHVAFMCH